MTDDDDEVVAATDIPPPVTHPPVVVPPVTFPPPVVHTPVTLPPVTIPPATNVSIPPLTTDPDSQVDLGRLPPVLSAQVKRVTEEGYAKKEVMDWEQYQTDFFRKTVIDLDTRQTTIYSDLGNVHASVVAEQIARTTDDSALASAITTVYAAVGAVNAWVISEQTARVDGDTAIATSLTAVNATIGDVNAFAVNEQTARVDGHTALASNITLVEAKADLGTAGGAVGIIATSGPAGVSASYGMYVIATSGGTNKYAGMSVNVSATTGDASMDFFSEQFRFVDSGVGVSVFEYNTPEAPGRFNFNVPVSIFNQDIGANAVSNTVANSSNTVAIGAYLTTPTLTVRAGARVIVEVKLTDTANSIYLASFSASFTSRLFEVDYYAGGGSGLTFIGHLYSMDTVVSSNYLGGSSYAFYKAYTPTSAQFILEGLPANTYDFYVLNSGGVVLGMAISATEISK